MLSLLAIEGECSGYDLLRQARKSVANIWAPAKTQLYAVLPRLVAAGLATQRAVVQERRPDKQLYRVTAAGRAALQRWLDDPDDIDRERVLSPALRRRARRPREPRRARRAVPRARRRRARAAARDRPDEHPHRARLLPLVPARARDRGVRAANPLGRSRARVAPGARPRELRLLVAAAGGAALTLGACASAAPHRRFAAAGAGRSSLPRLDVDLGGARRRAGDGDAAGRPSGADAGRGHARPGGRVRFALPGRPTPLAFNGRLRGASDPRHRDAGRAARAPSRFDAEAA